MIRREDMLELTRRMTASRNHFVRIGGAYIDEDGIIDGTINKNFQVLKGSDKEHSLEIAKAIPFGMPEDELKEYKLPQNAFKENSLWQGLFALLDCELKNDAILLNIYELMAENIPVGRPYAIYLYMGIYDVPVKSSDKEQLEGSEEIYKYIICAISPVDEDYNAHLPEAGFLWPAFKNRSSEMSYINIYNPDSEEGEAICKLLGI